MATGGAWQSETFDNGRDFQKERAPQHAAHAPPMGAGTPPAMYNSMGTTKDPGAFGVVGVCLRIAQIAVTVIAFSIMASNKETIYHSYYNYYYTDYYTDTVLFSAVKSFVGVVAMNSIVCLYAIVQLLHCFVNKSTKGSFLSSPTAGFAMLTFIFDTVLAYALIAASAAGADSAALFAGSTTDSFIQKASASVAMSFFAFALLALSAALWPLRLLRLTKSM